MIFNPAIMALLLGSALVTGMVLYSCYFGVQIVRKWNLKSGSELQLNLERRTYLISTIMTYALAFQLVSLFLFVYTADHLAPLFVGAMCAAGSLNVNDWGYPTIILKVLNFLLASLWLIINYVDNRASTYPLIKPKYKLLIALAPLIIAEFLLQASYFLELRPDIITSCCGSLFSSEAKGALGAVVGFARQTVEVVFCVIVAAVLTSGAYSWLRRRGFALFGVAGVLFCLTSILALISFISPYFYELPTHHCPFCLLQSEYGYVGYPLYLTLFGGTACALGVGVLSLFRDRGDIRTALAAVERWLSGVALVCYLVFCLVIGYTMIFSNLTMDF